MAVSNSNRSTLFANPACITAWRAEAKRVEQRSSQQALVAQNAQYVQNALALLDDLYCLNNPQQKNPMHVRQAAFAMFLEASLAGYPLAMFFEGLARKEGFGCQQDSKTGQALIHVAGARKCAEALNYLALCYCKQDLVSAFSMLRDAAHNGHTQALANFQQLAEHVRIQLKRRRKIIDFSAQPSRARLSL